MMHYLLQFYPSAIFPGHYRLLFSPTLLQLLGIRSIAATRQTKLITGLGYLLPLFVTVILGAYLLSTQADAAAISQGVKSSGGAQEAGTIVSLAQGSDGTVVPATPATAGRLFGVISNSSLLELSNNVGNNISVVVNGSTPALVSDINGAVNYGDPITASPITGVGMKATSSVQIVGTSLGSLKDNITGQQTVNTTSGKPVTVNVGLVALQVGISYYVAPPAQDYMPGFMRSFANSIAGQPVSAIRTIAGFLVLLAGFGASAVLLYTSIRTSLKSLGRNPLASSTIRRSLIQVIVVSVGVIAATVIGTYLIFVF